MALTIDIMHGRGPSNKMRTQLQAKNKAVLAIDMAAKGINALYITN